MQRVLGKPVRRLDRWASRFEDPKKRVTRLKGLLERQMRVHGPQSRIATTARVDLAEALEHVERFDEASEVRRVIVETLSATFGDDGVATLLEKIYLAVDLFRAGQVAEAREIANSVNARLSGVHDQHPELSDRTAELLRAIDARRDQTSSIRLKIPIHLQTGSANSSSGIGTGGNPGTAATKTVRGQFSVPAFGHEKSPPLGMSFQFLRA